MTGYTVNTGSTTEFAAGWDRIFGSDNSGARKSAKESARRTTKKSAGKPTAGKKERTKRAAQSTRSKRKG